MSKHIPYFFGTATIIGAIIFLGVQIPAIILLGEAFGVIGIAISLVLAETIQAVFYVISNKIIGVKVK